MYCQLVLLIDIILLKHLCDKIQFSLFFYCKPGNYVNINDKVSMDIKQSPLDALFRLVSDLFLQPLKFLKLNINQNKFIYLI